MSDLSYIDERGNTVFTPQYYRNRGYCCKSNCLHCPFGTTLNNLGLQFEELRAEDVKRAQQIIDDKTPPSEGIGASLLASGFGGAPKKKQITRQNKNRFKFIYLKEKLCGLVELSETQIKDLYLLRYFDEQGITTATVQGHLFH